MESIKSSVETLSEGSQFFQLSFLNVVLAIVLLFAFLFVRHTFYFIKVYWQYRSTPGYVSFLPPLINAMVNGRIYVHNQYECTLLAFKENPNAKVVKVQMGGSCQVLVARDTNLIKEIMVKKYKAISKGDVLAKVGLFGPNMFSADSTNPIWRKHRTLSNPIFSSSSHLKNV